MPSPNQGAPISTDIELFPQGGGRFDVHAWIPLRGALRFYDVDSVVDSYLPDGAEAHVRALMAEAGIQEKRI